MAKKWKVAYDIVSTHRNGEIVIEAKTAIQASEIFSKISNAELASRCNTTTYERKRVLYENYTGDELPYVEET